MDRVANQFDHEAVVQQTGADDADFPVVQRRHGVAKMGEVGEAGGLRRKHLRGGGRGVGGGTGDAELLGPADDFERPRHVRREGNDQRFGNRVNGLQLAEVGRSDELRVLRAGVFLIDERTFHMQAGGLAELLVGEVFGTRGRRFFQPRLRLSERGG